MTETDQVDIEEMISVNEDGLSISEDVLKALAQTGNVEAVHLFEQSNGRYIVAVACSLDKNKYLTLSSRRESARQFGSLDTVKRHLRNKFGLREFRVVNR